MRFTTTLLSIASLGFSVLPVQSAVLPTADLSARAEEMEKRHFYAAPDAVEKRHFYAAPDTVEKRHFYAAPDAMEKRHFYAGPDTDEASAAA
ncbi:hypothetical protein ISF_08865 [Cordyceps fumosorosea ARSEF 2679]|uniref:Uncharacterized protein n=1 Tax=Cordyceps fumosorosea (strain ARSEF 2679) TaxID=1081104 RepID=A0A167LM72_CORFA|nr:hypothetical protein ISF_08865 [Cordyceps fumosorosea ARSEF 2679]OAA53251.1 hypothetical protein ISF_08865 [Cordyceps fumosorosea ARSEF 2679]